MLVAGPQTKCVFVSPVRVSVCDSQKEEPRQHEGRTTETRAGEGESRNWSFVSKVRFDKSRYRKVKGNKNGTETRRVQSTVA